MARTIITRTGRISFIGKVSQMLLKRNRPDPSQVRLQLRLIHLKDALPY